MAMYFMGDSVNNLKYMDKGVNALYQNGDCLWVTEESEEESEDGNGDSGST